MLRYTYFSHVNLSLPYQFDVMKWESDFELMITSQLLRNNHYVSFKNNSQTRLCNHYVTVNYNLKIDYVIVNFWLTKIFG